MITPDKIEEWIKELEQRPESTAPILRFIANRLRELSNRNEELLEENIALMSGKRVEEYESRIAHLEYQLNLLKRQFGEEAPELAEITSSEEASQAATSLLVYDIQGHVYRLELSKADMASEQVVGQLNGDLVPEGNPARLLAVPSTEEVLFIFTTGRVVARPVMDLPLYPLPAEENQASREVAAPIPVEPRAGERLACLAPISRLSLAQFFVQASRKGHLKKINTSLAQSILANHYIGTGIKAAPDQSFELILCGSEDRLALVSQEGYLLCARVKDIPFAIEEAMRLGTSDHLVAALEAPSSASLLIMTQIGKVLHQAGDDLEVAASLRLKGKPVFSPSRRKQGVRVVGAAAVTERDWGVALHQDGQLSLHPVKDLFGKGAVETHGELLAFVGLQAT